MRRSQEAARTTKRKAPKCARKILVLLRPFVRGASPMGYSKLFFILRAGTYLIRLRRGRLRCGGSGERVRQEIPSCGLRDLYESAGQTAAEKARGRIRKGRRDFWCRGGREICAHCRL